MAGPLITLTSDFGWGSYVAQMKGVLLSRCPEARIVDLHHELPPQDVLAGRLFLQDVAPAFPPGTIHVAVVDPGVGTSRRGIVVRGGQTFVGPDNGLFTGFLDGAAVHALTEPRFQNDPVSPVFHGRDVFAPVAASLALGTAVESFGPEVPDPIRLELPPVVVNGAGVRGQVLYADHFGNLITNITGVEARSTVEIAGYRLALRRTYAEAGEGELLALTGSSGRLEVAVRNGSAAHRLSAGRGAAVMVRPV